MRIGIFGYGNLGRGVESAIRQNKDMELRAVFTRRDPAKLKIATPGVPVYAAADAAAHAGEVDVLILCGGERDRSACADPRDGGAVPCRGQL